MRTFMKVLWALFVMSALWVVFLMSVGFIAGVSYGIFMIGWDWAQFGGVHGVL